MIAVHTNLNDTKDLAFPKAPSKIYPWKHAVVDNDLKKILGGLNISFLGQAVLNKSHSLIKSLTHYNPDEMSDNHYTPLMLAALIDDKQSAGLLKKAGADSSLVNDDNNNAIDIACEHASCSFLEEFHNSPLIKENNTYLQDGNLTKWRQDIGNFCLKRNGIIDNSINGVFCETNEHFGNSIGYSLPATVATGVMAAMGNFSTAVNESTMNRMIGNMSSFHSEPSENLGWFTVAAVGGAAASILGLLVWGTWACLNLHKRAESYHKNIGSIELSATNPIG